MFQVLYLLMAVVLLEATADEEASLNQSSHEGSGDDTVSAAEGEGEEKMGEWTMTEKSRWVWMK